MRAHRVLKAPMSGPDDTRAVADLLGQEGYDASAVRALMCMTEGDGFARGYASLAFSQFFHAALGWDVADAPRRVPMLMIGGCSGLVVPYAAVFVEDPSLDGEPEDGQPGLSIGITTTRDVDIEEFGTTAMVDLVAEGVRDAMKDADLRTEDVHNVQIKALWPTESQLAAARAEGKRVAATSAEHAGALARGGGALGVAVALDEVDRNALRDEDIASNFQLRSEIASASAGTERTNVAVIVSGNSRSSRSPYRIGHGVLRDGIDVEGVHQGLRSAGIDTGADTGTSRPLADGVVDHVFVKSAVDLAGETRGRRHVLRSDYLSPYSWLIAKAVIHATVAGVVGDPMMQVSGGGEHQGPPGGGLVAVIARK